ncbi:hypothetical protein [Desulfurivibrio sp. C05AmB]|uniref:hypothetical protein n=1 Tax=Desulfurivibrio sp. C05AmB TaxID=3374371 RepID=UPI00376EA186
MTKIGPQTYQSLPSTQRAVAYFIAINRGDHAEAERLIEHAPCGSGQSKAFLGIERMLSVFNLLAGIVMRELLLIYGDTLAAHAYTKGWLDAGGATTDPNFLKHCKSTKDQLKAVSVMSGQLEALKEAARTWCDSNEVPEEVFASFLALIPMAKVDGEVVDATWVALYRKVFDEVKLT